MGIADTVYRNTLYLSAADLISKVFQFFVMLQATRLLSQADFGKFSLALSISFIIIVIADMGVNNFLIREIARSKKDLNKYVVNAIAIKAILLLFTLLITALFMFLAHYPSSTQTIVYVMWLFTLFGVFTELFYAVFRSFEAMHIDAMLKVARMSLLAILSIFVLWNGLGVVMFSLSFVAIEMVIATTAIFIGKAKFIKKFRWQEVNVVTMQQLFKNAFPLGVAFIFGSVYFYIGSIILSIIKGDVEVAIFSSAYNIVLALLFIPTMFTGALYPALSRLFVESKQKMSVLYEKSFKYLIIVGLPVSVFVFLLADEVVSLLYNESYGASAIVLKIIALYMLLKFINFLFGTMLSSADKQWERVKAQGIIAALSVVLSISLIVSFGVLGAAWAIVITEIVLFGVYFFYVNRFAPSSHLLKEVVKPSIASVAVVLCVIYIPLPLAASSVIGCVAYGAMLYVINGFDEKDKEIMRGIYENIQKNW